MTKQPTTTYGVSQEISPIVEEVDIAQLAETYLRASQGERTRLFGKPGGSLVRILGEGDVERVNETLNAGDQSPSWREVPEIANLLEEVRASVRLLEEGKLERAYWLVYHFCESSGSPSPAATDSIIGALCELVVPEAIATEPILKETASEEDAAVGIVGVEVADVSSEQNPLTPYTRQRFLDHLRLDGHTLSVPHGVGLVEVLKERWIPKQVKS